MISCLLTDGRNGFVKVHQFRHVVCQEMEERLDRRQTLVACGRNVLTTAFKIIEELDNKFASELIDVEIFRLCTETCTSKVDQ